MVELFLRTTVDVLVTSNSHIFADAWGVDECSLSVDMATSARAQHGNMSNRKIEM